MSKKRGRRRHKPQQHTKQQPKQQPKLQSQARQQPQSSKKPRRPKAAATIEQIDAVAMRVFGANYYSAKDAIDGR